MTVDDGSEKSICFINGAFPPFLRGGAENYIIQIARELENRGYRTSLITTKKLSSVNDLGAEEVDIEGISTYRFAPPNIASRSTFPDKNLLEKSIWRLIDLVNPYTFRTVGKILDQISPDIVHSHNLMGISTVATKQINDNSNRHIHTLHDYSLICPTGSPRSNKHELLDDFYNKEAVIDHFSGVQKSLFSQPNVVLAPSQHIIHEHCKRGFFNGVPTECVQLGIERSSIQQPCKVNSSNRAIYVGRITKRKGLDILLKAADQNDEFTYDICGSGPYENVVERQADRRSNVTYHGYVDSSRLSELRQKADVAIVPSLWMENSPLTIYESFARGLPVVASDIGGIPELVSTGETGALFRPGDPKALVDTLHSVIDSGRLDRMSEKCISWAKDHTTTHHVDQLERVYFEDY